MTELRNETIIGNLLRQRGWRLATAESCTGGLIGDKLTNVAGSSTYFVGGIIAYSYNSKVRMLGVKWETLEKYGAVSQEVVLQMARGARHALAADVGLSISGIAGPGGGTGEKPVGTTWVGLSTPFHEESKLYTWHQDRIGNKRLSADAALQFLADYLRSHSDGKN